MIEQDIQNEIRIAASEMGWRLFRNNSGGGVLQDGSFVRWGLANDSTALNAKMKSSDLIGIRPVVITQDMVGQTIGQFVSLEVKRPCWKQPRNDHERAQEAWLKMINELGGFAMFITDKEALK